jgi:hypothetical protein
MFSCSQRLREYEEWIRRAKIKTKSKFLKAKFVVNFEDLNYLERNIKNKKRNYKDKLKIKKQLWLQKFTV